MKSIIRFNVDSRTRQATFFDGENMIGNIDVEKVTAEYLEKIIGDERQDQKRATLEKIEIVKKSLAKNFPPRSAAAK